MKIGIIGAGPAGLEALRLSLRDGHTCEAFEKTENIGGIWNYTDKTGNDEYGLQIQSSMYQGLKTNLPKELMQYEDFPYKKPKHSYISYPEVMQYMNDFATTFNLLPHIKFLNYVERVSYLPNGKWSLEIKELKTQEKEQREFDAVFVCIGNVSSLSIPHIPGKENFNGSIIHSHDYRKPDSYKNKRVLVIGSGSSGKDVTKFVANVAEKVILSHRSPLDSSFKLPPGVVTKPVVMEFKETSVLFADGSEEDIDAVVFCTGYLIDFPCLSPSCGIEVDNKWVKYLYKDIINVEHPTMAITGMLFPIFRFPLYGIQVRFFLSYLKENVSTTKEDMMKDITNHVKTLDKPNLRAHEMTLDRIDKYFDDLAESGKIQKLKPVFIKLFKHIWKDRQDQRNLSYDLVNDEEFVERSN
nr:senecionine N-oxygenase-like [Leptinotarsa decemlineata]